MGAQLTEASPGWVIAGGVGGRMWLGSSPGVWPYRWVSRPRDARHWTHREHAEAVVRLLRAQPDAEQRHLADAVVTRA